MMDDMAKPERRFIIVTPHQSVGPPGTEVPASRLHMDDEQLDAYVDAGHATEVFRQRPSAAKDVTKVTRSNESSITTSSSNTTSSSSSRSGKKDDDDGKSDD